MLAVFSSVCKLEMSVVVNHSQALMRCMRSNIEQFELKRYQN